MEGAAIGYQSPQFVPRDSIIMPTPPTHQPSSVTYPAVITEVFSTSPPTISCYLLRQVWHNYTWIYESQTSQECWVKVPSKSTMHIFRPWYPSTKDSCLIVKHKHYLYFHSFCRNFLIHFETRSPKLSHPQHPLWFSKQTSSSTSSLSSSADQKGKLRSCSVQPRFNFPDINLFFFFFLAPWCLFQLSTDLSWENELVGLVNISRDESIRNWIAA